MRRFVLTAALIVAFALPAAASNCVQSDGQPGIQLVGVEGDAGCQTASEYAEVFSVDNLVAVGALTDVVDNGDGTVTARTSLTGWNTTITASPLDRPVAANPSEFDTAPTVGEVLYPATANRLSALVG